MRIKLKEAAKGVGTNIHDGEGKEFPVGTILTVREDPLAWAGRYDILDGSSAADDDGKTPVDQRFNPKKASREEMLTKLSDLGVTVPEGATDKDLQALYVDASKK